jgi:hypothetical protein
MYCLSSRGADSDTDHCLVVAKLRERLAVSKQATQMFDVERSNLWTPDGVKDKISNRSAALENLSSSEGINRVWENIKENIKASAKDSLVLHELKQHKPWFDEEFLSFLDQRNQAKLQWLQDPNQSNLD